MEPYRMRRKQIHQETRKVGNKVDNCPFEKHASKTWAESGRDGMKIECK